MIFIKIGKFQIAFIRYLFEKKKINIYITRGPCRLLALLVNPRSQGLRLLQPMLAKSHLILADIKQILIRFVYMSDQEKK